MRIAWFTPFRKASAIGRFSRAVTDVLSRSARVDLWIAESEMAEPLHETQLLVVRYAAFSRAERMLAEYDVVVYNLGDHSIYHGPIFEMSRLTPGIVVLHDYVMHNFFTGYCDQHRAWDHYAALMKRWHNADLQLTPAGWEGETWRVWERDEVIRYPLFEEAVVGSTGVVTHADFVREAVARVVVAPVAKIPLAFPADSIGPTLSRAQLNVPDDRVLGVTLGVPNENKRIQVVLEALAGNPKIARSLTYSVIGDDQTPFARKLMERCQQLGLDETVRFTGYASDELLRSYLARADFCVNLRLPAMEGGSASCAEQMLYGKPVIVTDTGVYRELPDDCVCKVRPDHESEDLSRHLFAMVFSSKLRRQIGRRARNYAEAHFTPEVYAERFLEFCKEWSASRPALDLVDTAGRELRRMGVTAEMGIVDGVSREAERLFHFECSPPILRQPE